MSLCAVVCAALVAIKPLTRTLRNVITPHPPSQTPGICAAQVPQLSEWHCHNSAALCIVTACSEAAEPVFPRASAIFPFSFLAPLFSSCFSQGIVPVNLSCAVMGSFHRNWFWSVGTTRTKPPLHCLVLYISVYAGKIQPHCTTE